MSITNQFNIGFLRTACHVAEEERNNNFKNQIYSKSFMMGSHECATTSLVKTLQGKPGILRLIHDFAKPDPLNENQFFYKAGLMMCTGVEHVHFEALQQPRDLDGRGVQAGVLLNQPIGSCKRFLLPEFLKEFASKKNPDGSWWNEGQLRSAWKEFCFPRFCDDPEGACMGRCCALCGDTILFWFCAAYPVSTGSYIPATQADLIERGFVDPGKGLAGMGELYQYAKLVRDDPSQLEENGGDSNPSNAASGDAGNDESAGGEDGDDAAVPPTNKRVKVN